MPKLPFMQFYPSDWLVDTQILTPLAKAAWIDIICQLWISPTPGTLRWNRGAFTTYLRLDYDEHIDQVVAELSRVAVLELLDSDNNEVEKFEDCTWIEISSRRILRDVERLNKRKDTHKKYNKTRDKNDSKTTAERQSNDSKTTPIYQKSEVRSQNLKSPPAPPEPSADPKKEEPEWKKIADTIYQSDLKRFGRLMQLINWAEKEMYSEAIIKTGLEKLWRALQGNQINDWWPYARKCLEKAYTEDQQAQSSKNKEEEARFIAKLVNVVREVKR